MQKTVLATVLAILALFFSAPAFAQEDLLPRNAQPGMQMKEQRMEAKEVRKETQATMQSMREQYTANPTPELKAEMVAAAKQHVSALGDHVLAFIARVTEKLSAAAIFAGDEDARATFIASLERIAADVRAAQASVDAVTDFAGLREVRVTLRASFQELRTTLGEIKTAMQELRAALKVESTADAPIEESAATPVTENE